MVWLATYSTENTCTRSGPDHGGGLKAWQERVPLDGSVDCSLAPEGAIVLLLSVTAVSQCLPDDETAICEEVTRPGISLRHTPQSNTSKSVGMVPL